MPALEPDNNVPAIIADHAYAPRDPDEPWGLCTCGLAEAAHSEALAPYIPDSPRAEKET